MQNSFYLERNNALANSISPPESSKNLFASSSGTPNVVSAYSYRFLYSSAIV